MRAVQYSAAQVEQRIAAQVRDLAYVDLPTLMAARRSYAETRAGYGFQLRPGLFLSDETDITKLSAGIGRHTLALALPPAESSGIADLCPWADHCVAACVGTGGSNRYESAARGKSARLALLMDDAPAALALICHGLDQAAAKYGPSGVGMRLNTYSDLRFERILPAWFWDRYADVAFYDYTKHPIRSRPQESLPSNYRLTYSVSPRSTDLEISKQRGAGRSVAVVVEIRGGKDRGTGYYRPLPVDVDGIHTVDGDADDRRYTDPAGSLVMLRRKNGLSAEDPLVVPTDRLRRILDS